MSTRLPALVLLLPLAAACRSSRVSSEPDPATSEAHEYAVIALRYAEGTATPAEVARLRAHLGFEREGDQER